MSQLIQVSPLLDGMELEEELAGREGSRVFRLCHTATGVRCTVKQLVIPASDMETKALIVTGAVKDLEEAHAYYSGVVDRYRAELAAFRAMVSSPFVSSYSRFQVTPREGRPGFVISLLAPVRTSLKSWLQENSITCKQAPKLGSDLCSALCVLRENGYLHHNLKPENIFVENGNFSIGDFGLSSTEDLEHAVMPAARAGSFTAPEACGSSGVVSATMDIYSVGMLLYYIYNGCHMPFEEADSTAKSADRRRLSGEALPAPIYADYEMDTIIRKACAFLPEDRYESPAEMLQALNDYQERNELSDDVLVPPLVVEDEPIDWKQDEDVVIHPLNFAKKENLSEDFKENFTPASEDAEERPRRRLLWIPIVLVFLLLVSAAFCYYYFEYSAITIDKIAVIDKGTDFLTLSVDGSDLDALKITCSTGGQQVAAYTCAETVTFADLKPGTLYEIVIEAVDFRHVKGILGGTAVTSSITEVLAFDVSEQADGTWLATFLVSGPEPEEWKLTLSAEGVEPVTLAAKNHSCVLENVLPDTEYTLTLDTGSGYNLTGKTKTSFSYTIPILGSNLELAEKTIDTITVTWESDSELPTVWTAVCSGDNGYASTVLVEDCTATFEGTSVNAEYTIAVSNEYMTAPLLLTMYNNGCTVNSVTAAAEGNTIEVSWDVSGELIPEKWLLTYGLQSIDDPVTVEVTGSSVLLEDLLPDAAYFFVLEDASGNKPEGNLEASAHTEPAEDHDNGNRIGGFFSTLFDRPDGFGWSAINLGPGKSTFKPGAAVVYAMEPYGNVKKEVLEDGEEPEPVAVMLIIRNEAGEPVAYSVENSPWNDLWDEKLFYTTIMESPEETGDYTIELYFDFQLVDTRKLVIAE